MFFVVITISISCMTPLSGSTMWSYAKIGNSKEKFRKRRKDMESLCGQELMS